MKFLLKMLCYEYSIRKKRNTLFEKLLSHLRIHFNRITWVEDLNFLPATCRGWGGWASPKHQPTLTHPAISQTCFLTQKQFVENWFEFGDFHLYYTPKLNVHLCSAGFLHFDYFRLIHTGLPAPGFVPKWLLVPPHPLSFLIPVCVLTVFFCLILVFLDWRPWFLKSKKQKVQFYCQLFLLNSVLFVKSFHHFALWVGWVYYPSFCGELDIVNHNSSLFSSWCVYLASGRVNSLWTNKDHIVTRICSYCHHLTWAVYSSVSEPVSQS